MTESYFWICLILIALSSQLSRLSFIGLSGRLNIHPEIQRALKFLSPAVFPALFMPAIIYGNDASGFSFTNMQIYAAIVALIIAWKTKNVFLTLGAGMACLWGLEYLL